MSFGWNSNINWPMYIHICILILGLEAVMIALIISFSSSSSSQYLVFTDIIRAFQYADHRTSNLDIFLYIYFQIKRMSDIWSAASSKIAWNLFLFSPHLTLSLPLFNFKTRIQHNQPNLPCIFNLNYQLTTFKLVYLSFKLRTYIVMIIL